LLVQTSIMNTIRDNLPVEQLLRQYIDETQEVDVNKVETIIDNKPLENVLPKVETKFKPFTEPRTEPFTEPRTEPLIETNLVVEPKLSDDIIELPKTNTIRFHPDVEDNEITIGDEIHLDTENLDVLDLDIEEIL